MKKHLFIGFLIHFSIWFSAAAHDGHHAAHETESDIPNIVINPAEGENPWTNLVFNNDPSNFQFAVVTDRTGGHRAGVFEDAVKKLNLLQPEFVMSVGDLIEGYTTDRDELEYQWNEFDGFVEKLEMPFFYVPGNHDYTNEVMANVWKERLGASYYSFTYRDVLFVMLNSNSANRPHHMTQDQVDWLKGVLEANPNPRWTLIFVHAPLWDRPEGKQDLWPKVDALLQGRKYTVFAGHVHAYTKQIRKNRNYYTLATTGGGSGLRGSRFGEFDHVVWVTMTDEGPLLANLLLEGIWDDNVRTEEVRSLQEKWIDSGSLNIQPILYRNQFTSGETELRLTNDSDIPYQLDVDLKLLGNVSLDSGFSHHITVNPNEIETIPLSVSSDGLTGEQSVLELDWNMQFNLQDEEVKYEGSENLVLIQEFPVPSIHEVVIDGNFGDWENLSYTNDPEQVSQNVVNWKSSGDSSFKWDLGQDGETLFIAVAVKDDNISSSKDDAAWVQDTINVAVDPRPARIRNFNHEYGGKGEEYCFFSLSPEVDSDDVLNHYPVGIPEGANYVLTKTEDGYNLELSIPFAVLDEMAEGEWSAFRINIIQGDRDEGEQGLCAQVWKQLWFTKGALPGSGTFYRE